MYETYEKRNKADMYKKININTNFGNNSITKEAQV